MLFSNQNSYALMVYLTECDGTGEPNIEPQVKITLTLCVAVNVFQCIELLIFC